MYNVYRIYIKCIMYIEQGKKDFAAKRPKIAELRQAKQGKIAAEVLKIAAKNQQQKKLLRSLQKYKNLILIQKAINFECVLSNMIYDYDARSTKKLPIVGKKVAFPNSATLTKAVTVPCFDKAERLLLGPGKILSDV